MPTASLSDAAQPSARITVIGAGVIGLSTAHELASAGHQVTVIHDQDPLETVSAVAAAIWFPYHSENSQAADLLLRRSWLALNSSRRIRRPVWTCVTA